MRTVLIVAAFVLASGCARSTAAPTEPASTPKHASQPNAKHDGHRHGHHRFENADEWAEQFDNPERDAWQKPDEVIAFLGLKPDAVVADLGAGTGYFAVKIAAVVPEGKVLANDVEPDMVRYLGERAQKEGLANIVPVQGSAAGPELPEPADVAFLCDVYHHLADRPAYFGKVREQLRPGGKLVIVDFRKDAAEDIPGPPPAMRVAATDLIAELEGAGWTHVRTDAETLPHQYIVELVPAT
jgi:SAM-dependent methyltransferase